MKLIHEWHSFRHKTIKSHAYVFEGWYGIRLDPDEVAFWKLAEMPELRKDGMPFFPNYWDEHPGHTCLLWTSWKDPTYDDLYSRVVEDPLKELVMLLL